MSVNFLLCRVYFFAATAKGVLKIFHQSLWKTPVKELIFLSFRQRICSFIFTAEIIHSCSSRILVAPSAGSFTDSYFQIFNFWWASFVAPKLLWDGLPPFLDQPPPPPPPPPLCLTHPFIFKFFQHYHYTVFWRHHTPSNL